jgi:hypothetical protein
MGAAARPGVATDLGAARVTGTLGRNDWGPVCFCARLPNVGWSSQAICGGGASRRILYVRLQLNRALDSHTGLMFRITPFRLFALIAVAVGAFFWPSFAWMQQVDECVVSGGAMDYGDRVCSVADSVSTPEPRAWYVRPSRFEFVGGVTAALILAVVFVARDRIDDSGPRAI